MSAPTTQIISVATIRQEFEDPVRWDLLGPAGGEQEIVTEQSIRNWLLQAQLEVRGRFSRRPGQGHASTLDQTSRLEDQTNEMLARRSGSYTACGHRLETSICKADHPPIPLSRGKRGDANGARVAIRKSRDRPGKRHLTMTDTMAGSTFQAAAVIGTGMMGPGIAAVFAAGGLRTVILSRDRERGCRAVERAAQQISLLEEHGLLPSETAQRGRELLSASTDYEASVADVDIVIESGPENMQFKQELFARLDAATKATAILASNTSGLSITDIASRCAHPERVLTTHFWNPPHLMPLVEIVKGKKTDLAAVEAVRCLLQRCGKTPVIVKKDTPGQLGNRLQMALVREAVNIVQQGIADAEAVDLAAKAGFGLRLPVYGILEHQDMVGLDMGSAIVDYVSRDLSNHVGMPPLMREMLDRGELGVKSGKGFYDWSQRDPEAVKARRDRFVLEMLKNGYVKPS